MYIYVDFTHHMFTKRAQIFMKITTKNQIAQCRSIIGQYRNTRGES